LNHGNKVRKLGRTNSHRRAMLRNMVQQLIVHERIQTTLPKAREAARSAERMFRHARQDTVAARREAAKFIADRAALHKLFSDIGPRFADRAGGCTRILRLGTRQGDGAEMALLELVVRRESEREKQAKEKAAKGTGRKKAKSSGEDKPKKTARGKKSS
jgi:large subunit ribosomal protein L17